MGDLDKINWKWLLGILGINLLYLLIHYLVNKTSIKYVREKYELDELSELIVKINQDNQLIAQSFDKLHQDTMTLMKQSPKPFKISASAVCTFWALKAQYPRHHFDKHSTAHEIIRHRDELFEYHQQVLTASQSVLELRHLENKAQLQKMSDNLQLTNSRQH